MATHYYIHQERILSIVANFFNAEDSYKHHIDESKKEYDIYISNASESDVQRAKLKGILKIFFSSSKCSFQIQGKDTFNDVCARCRDKIIEEGQIQNIQSVNKCFTYHKVSSESFNEILEWLRMKPDLNIINHPGDVNIISRHTICGPFDSHVSITYFHTETMLIQGLISSLLLRIVQDVNALMDVDECNGESAFLKVLEALPHEIIQSDLSVHLPNVDVLDNTPYGNMILSSIHLVNSNIELGDYTCVAFGVLRALEGVLGHRMNLTQAMTGKTDFLGNFFCEDASGGNYHFNSRFPHYNAKPNLKRACERGYTHYNSRRHPYFHTDIPNPINTYVICSKELAIDLVNETIERIKDIMKHWHE